MRALDPETETFSTPPTTPGLATEALRPSISRRNSRPTSLHIDQSTTEWNSDIVLEENSPGHLRKALSPHNLIHDQTATPRKAVTPFPNPINQRQISDHHPKSMESPCFVHSHLDKGASLTDWLRVKQNGIVDGIDVSVAKSLQHTDEGQQNPHYSPSDQAFTPPGSGASSVLESNDEDEFGGSLTKQLAETAVGVREMSKQLGRARVWSNIQNVLIITKARDNRLIRLTRELALYLMLKPRSGQTRGLVVYVDNQLRDSRRFDADGIERDHPELFTPFPRRRTSSTSSLHSMTSAPTYKEEFYLKDEGQLRYWTSDMCSHSPHLFDFVVTLGGDGTVLFTSWLFQRIVPPVLPFALGSLGFLTNFDFADHQAVMDSAIDSGIRVNLRMRFTCTVYRAVSNEEGKGRKAVKKGETGEIIMKNVEKGGWEALEDGWSGGFALPDGKHSNKDKEIMCFTTRPVETFEVLNDLVVDRGPSPYVSLLELFGDEHHMTTVQADGLTVSTPTGSTAYSLSAGGSLVHPEIPALLITPICPHTLSFRPMLLPDSMELRICVPFNSRSTAWASFDGRGRVELKQGDHIKVTASKYPFPTVCADKQSTDWFHAISRTLKWNERERQKSFVVVEEGPAKPKKRRRRGISSRTGPSEQRAKTSTAEPVEETIEDDEEDEVSEEEDDQFDIDDSSPEAATLNAAKVTNSQTPQEDALGREKIQEREQRPRVTVETTTSTYKKGPMRTSKSRSRSRSSGLRSEVDSPGRFAGSRPHPPPLLTRHVEFTLRGHSPTDSSSSLSADSVHEIHSPRPSSRVPKDRDMEADAIKTPTIEDVVYGRTRVHSQSSLTERHGHRAFAVWGQDESDSNTSDSDT